MKSKNCCNLNIALSISRMATMVTSYRRVRRFICDNSPKSQKAKKQ